MSPHLLYALAWVSFGLVHSGLARPAAICWLRGLVGGWQRLTYNLIALAHLAVVLLFGRSLLGTDPPDVPLFGVVRVLLGGVTFVGLAIVVGGVWQHKLIRFLGLRLQTDAEAEAPLQTGGFYRWVRHPIYFGALLVVWGLAQSPLGLATACWATLYTLVGTLFEERDLAAKYGAAYRDFQQRVPMLIPWPRR
jgi:protein-S-isoprenylcysteine O-methyltransferase Ste14